MSAGSLWFGEGIVAASRHCDVTVISFVSLKISDEMVTSLIFIEISVPLRWQWLTEF